MTGKRTGEGNSTPILQSRHLPLSPAQDESHATTRNGVIELGPTFAEPFLTNDDTNWTHASLDDEKYNWARQILPHDIRDLQVIAPNISRHLSGVTATLERVVAVQAEHIKIAALGTKLAAQTPRIGIRALLKLWRRPPSGRPRIWHARRNIEMLVGIILRDILRFPLRLVFTSASQRQHTQWTRFLIGRMDSLIATSTATATYLEHPSTVVPHGIEASTFRPALDRAAVRRELGLPNLRLVGCFGRIRQGKGSDVFVEAMLRVLASRSDVGAVLVGRATSPHVAFMEKLRKKIHLAGFEQRFLILPEVATFEMPDWYRALDIYVAPQRWEGFGVTVLEAMASGLPVVATKVGAFPDIVTKETGVLVAPSDVDAMVAAISGLLDAPEGSAEMGKTARLRAIGQFSIEDEAKHINQVYWKLLTEADSRFSQKPN